MCCPKASPRFVIMVWTVRPAQSVAQPPWPCSKPTKAPHPNPLPQRRQRRRSLRHPFASQAAVGVAPTAVARSSASGISCPPEKSLHECRHRLLCSHRPLAQRPVQFAFGRCTSGLCPRWIPKPPNDLGSPPAKLRCPTRRRRSGWSTHTASPQILPPLPIKLQVGDRGSDSVQRGFCCGESRLRSIPTRSTRRNKNLNSLSEKWIFFP